MKRYITLGLLVALIFSVGVALAAKPDLTTPHEVEPSGGHATVFIPERAVKVAPGVFSLGTAIDVDGKIVEGFMFIDNKKGKAKPGTVCGNKICEPGENAKKCPEDCTGNGDTTNGGKKCFAVIAKGARWKTTEQYVTGDEIDTPLTETSLTTWDKKVSFEIFGIRNVSGITDGADSESPDGKNEVEFVNLGPTDTIAYTIVWGTFYGPPSQRELREWDVVFNKDYPFGDAGPTDEVNPGDTSVMDYQNIATHEFGHALGLWHPDDSCTEETMYRYANYGETKKRTLGVGDVKGVQELYS